MTEKQSIQKHIHQQKETASENEKNMWGLMQSWLGTWTLEQFEAKVKAALAEAEGELKQPYNPSDSFDLNWRNGAERDARVFGDMVKWIDQTQKTERDQ